ncbi:MAG: hypothetical protein ACOCUS_06870 [Polyangiales bacterium]
MFIFPIAHVAVGVGITYGALATLLNTTTVRVTRGELHVRHFPLPWWPAPRIPTNALEQLYVERKVTSTKNGTKVRWNLRAVTRGHSGQKIVGGLEDMDQALYLEQEIESVLDIRDRAVAGEYRPGQGAQA